MNEYSAGDLVEAVKGESVIRGRLIREGLHLWVGDSGRTPENIESYGFTLSIIEKAAAVVVLPTEPGLYSASGFPVEDDYAPYRLSKAGTWNEVGMRSCDAKFMGKAGTLTRLEPVSATAEKVLDRVRTIFYGDRTCDLALDLIAKDFGVEL